MVFPEEPGEIRVRDGMVAALLPGGPPMPAVFSAHRKSGIGVKRGLYNVAGPDLFQRLDAEERPVSPPASELPWGFPMELLRPFKPGEEVAHYRWVQVHTRAWLQFLGERIRLPSVWKPEAKEDQYADWPVSDNDWEVIRSPLERTSAVRVDWNIAEICTMELARRCNGVPFSMYELLNSSRKSVEDYMYSLRMPEGLKIQLMKCWSSEHQRARSALDYKRARHIFCLFCKSAFWWPPKGDNGWSPRAVTTEVKAKQKAYQAKKKKLAAAATVTSGGALSVRLPSSPVVVPRRESTGDEGVPRQRLTPDTSQTAPTYSSVVAGTSVQAMNLMFPHYVPVPRRPPPF